MDIREGVHSWSDLGKKGKRDTHVQAGVRECGSTRDGGGHESPFPTYTAGDWCAV